MTQKTCALYGCNNPVSNWRMSCCSRSHQQQYAGKQSRKSNHKPNQTKKEFLVYVSEYVRAKHFRQKNATPTWANKDKIKEIYAKAADLTLETGIKHEVDHIVPLTNDLVCGLHVEHNLRVITLNENRKKHNKFVV